LAAAAADLGDFGTSVTSAAAIPPKRYRVSPALALKAGEGEEGGGVPSVGAEPGRGALGTKEYERISTPSFGFPGTAASVRAVDTSYMAKVSNKQK
jgi:hypothetical protein